MNYQEAVKIGLNHHLLYCNVCDDPIQHEQTLIKVLEDNRLEVVDVWIPKQADVRKREVDALKQSGKDVYYNIGTRKGMKRVAPASLDPAMHSYTMDFYKDELDRAIEAKAKKVITNSGPDFPETRQACIDVLVDFYCEICDYVPADMLIMVEPTDREVDKKKLMGPSCECVELCKRIHKAGFMNFSSMVDMGHVPLMGETIEEAMTATGVYNGHIHMGNCILKDHSHPLFGDKHVPFGLEGSEYDVDDISELIRVGLEIGYFQEGRRGSASFEIRPYPDKTPEVTLDIAFEKFEQAWEKIITHYE